MCGVASYSLPILFGTELSLNHLKSLKEISRLKFHHNLPIQNIYGSPSDAVWNGGRNLENAEIRRFFEGDVERYFRYVHELLDTNMFLTFSNHLAGDYLNDKVSNFVLDSLIALKNKNSGVIISDDRLVNNNNVLSNFKNITDKLNINKHKKIFLNSIVKEIKTTGKKIYWKSLFNFSYLYKTIKFSISNTNVTENKISILIPTRERVLKFERF